MDYKAMLLDIEGTTTSISFVHDILFPFARRHLESFLVTRWDDPLVQLQVRSLKRQAAHDIAEGVEGAVAIPGPEAAEGEVRAATLANLRWQMDHDRKTTALKALQGMIWTDGYASGELKADVFEDIPGAFERWKQAGVAIYIYSSGSVDAQRLLFGHTHHGDLTPYLSGHFDTTTGPKKDPDSYRAIARIINLDPSEVLFATDVVAEAEAAAEAGMRAVIMDRPGNAPQPEHPFEVWADFAPRPH